MTISIQLQNILIEKTRVIELEVEKEIWPLLQIGDSMSIHFTNWSQLDEFRDKLNKALIAHYEAEMEADRITAHSNELTSKTS